MRQPVQLNLILNCQTKHENCVEKLLSLSFSLQKKKSLAALSFSPDFTSGAMGT